MLSHRDRSLEIELLELRALFLRCSTLHFQASWAFDGISATGNRTNGTGRMKKATFIIIDHGAIYDRAMGNEHCMIIDAREFRKPGIKGVSFFQKL